jgi:hypothetical protein
MQKQGRSPLATLQQNKRDDARLFFKLESSLLFCADAQTADPFEVQLGCFRFCINNLSLIMDDKKYDIQYWRQGAEKSWRIANILIENEHKLEALFFWHLTIEKLLKAHWKDKSLEKLPKNKDGHNLNFFYKTLQLSIHDNIKMEANELQKVLQEITYWNIAARYPDPSNDFYGSDKHINQKKGLIENLRTCLLEKLP